jgi:hypothetical protein
LPAGGRHSRYTWCDLLEQFQEFAAQAVFDTHETGGVAARPRQAGTETGADLDRRSWRWMALTGDPMATAGSIVRKSTEREAFEQLSVFGEPSSREARAKALGFEVPRFG